MRTRAYGRSVLIATLKKDVHDPEFWGLCALAAMLMLFA